jgi:hypothetical protein
VDGVVGAPHAGALDRRSGDDVTVFIFLKAASKPLCLIDVGIAGKPPSGIANTNGFDGLATGCGVDGLLFRAYEDVKHDDDQRDDGNGEGVKFDVFCHAARLAAKCR